MLLFFRLLSLNASVERKWLNCLSVDEEQGVYCWQVSVASQLSGVFLCQELQCVPDSRNTLKQTGRPWKAWLCFQNMWCWDIVYQESKFGLQLYTQRCEHTWGRSSSNLFGGQVLVKQIFMYLRKAFISAIPAQVKSEHRGQINLQRNDDPRRLIDLRKESRTAKWSEMREGKQDIRALEDWRNRSISRNDGKAVGARGSERAAVVTAKQGRSRAWTERRWWRWWGSKMKMSCIMLSSLIRKTKT